MGGCRHIEKGCVRIGFVRVESYSHVDVLGDGYDLPSEFMEKRVQMQQILSQVST